MYCIKLELVTTLTYCCLIQQYLSILSTWLHRYYLNWTRSHHTSTWFLITFLCWWHTALSLISTRRSNGICMDLRLLDLALHNIRKIRPFLTPHAAQLLVQALVISRLDYCNALLAGLPSNTIKPLQMIQNAAARLVFNEPKRAHVTPLFVSLHWLPVAARIHKKKTNWKHSEPRKRHCFSDIFQATPENSSLPFSLDFIFFFFIYIYIYIYKNTPLHSFLNLSLSS